MNCSSKQFLSRSGRRGVFDGTIENMHLHWKYRELVKIITNENNIEAVHQVARSLETESGGILVAVERVSKGYAIIMYRGKNYIRPASLRPKTLLSKKAALKRSIEAQRREVKHLHFHHFSSKHRKRILEILQRCSAATPLGCFKLSMIYMYELMFYPALIMLCSP